MWDIVHLVGFTAEIYIDARSYKRQIRDLLSKENNECDHHICDSFVNNF
jgi:hypothetical protein